MSAILEKTKEDIKNSILSNIPIIYIETEEHKRGLEIVKEISNDISIPRLKLWSEFIGMKDVYTEEIEIKEYDFKKFLTEISNTKEKTIIVIQNLHNFMKDISNISAILGIIEKITQKGLPIIIVTLSTSLLIPKDITQYVNYYELPYPSREEINLMIDKVFKENEIDLDKVTKSFFIESLNGLSEDQVMLMIYSTISKVLSEKRYINNEDVESIIKQKRQIINKSGVIEAVDNDSFHFNDIGGLDNLKAWMETRKKVFSNMQKAKEWGVIPPRGLFLFGMPGVGKSLTSKVIASYYNLPLLKLDMALIFGSNEPEAAIRRALKLATAIAPCILWVDEVEKAFAGTEAGTTGGETAMRVFGQVLTWMEENTAPVLTVASANDISNIRGELIRRFDEMFFVDFPSKQSEIEAIFEVHLRRKLGEKRKTYVEELNYAAIHKKMKQIVKRYGGHDEAGYSGSDIEKIVKEVLNMAYTTGLEKITTKHFITRIAEIRPQRGDVIAKMKKAAQKMDAIPA